MLGARIRAAADFQSKLINAAYEEARAERQFLARHGLRFEEAP